MTAEYERNMERINRGNPPEIQAKLDAGRERFLAAAREHRERRIQGARMKGILPDINAGKHMWALMSIWISDSWRDLWYGLGLAVGKLPGPGTRLRCRPMPSSGEPAKKRSSF